MKKNEIVEGSIYGDAHGRCRKVHKIANGMVSYQSVGEILIRNKIHFMNNHSSCSVKTFQKWAEYGVTEERFLQTRQSRDFM